MTNYIHDEHLGWVIDGDIIETKEKVISSDSPEHKESHTQHSNAEYQTPAERVEILNSVFLNSKRKAK